LLKADKVTVVFERSAFGEIRVTTSSWDDAKVFAQSGARGGQHRQAGRAGPGGQADRLPGHRRHGAG
jgi:hypothetical protein